MRAFIKVHRERWILYEAAYKYGTEQKTLCHHAFELSGASQQKIGAATTEHDFLSQSYLRAFAVPDTSFQVVTRMHRMHSLPKICDYTNIAELQTLGIL